MKTCNKCDETKALTEFYKRENSPDDHRHDCKSCLGTQKKAYREAHPEKIKARRKAHYEANKEEILAKHKIWYEANKGEVKVKSKARYEANKEEILGKNKIWRETNPEKNKARLKAYYEANKEKLKAHHNAYYEANPEKIKARKKVYEKTPRGRFVQYKSGAKSRNIPFLLTEEQFKSFWQAPCSYCGAEIKTIGLDRTNSDGPYHIDNVVPCCIVCNRAKGARTLKEFAETTLRRAKILSPEEFSK